MPRLTVTLLLCLMGVLGRAQAVTAVPQVLRDWQAWVLKDKEFHRCPFLAGSDSTEEDAHRCAWPGRLQLEADAHGARFAQRWQLYAESWVALPGDDTHWPRHVLLDSRPAPLVARDGVPSVRLGAGVHQLSGEFLWPRRPETLAIPAETALVDLTVDGRVVLHPERSATELALGRQQDASEPRELEVQVYRQVVDDIPLRLSTRVQLRAAGDAREELIGGALPPGFVPLAISSALPARLESDGRLRVQVRTGSFEVVLEARQAEPAATLALPQGTREEVWSFAANDRLRVATAEGVQGIDPAQASVPEPWRRYPAFRMQPGARLQLVEHGRGIVTSDQNHVRLLRRVWLDFDHAGLTAVDELSGTLRRDWRLAMRAPYQLASAHTARDWLLITAGARAGESGIELRDPTLNLTTVARAAHPFAALPATGWTGTIDSAQGELYLPPGHRLLAVLGADEAPTAWVERYGSWALFGVLLLSAASYWLAGARVATLAALTLLLTYPAAPWLMFFWANLLLALLLTRAAAGGWPARLVRGYRLVSLVVLAAALAPVMWSELRHALYPQLDARAPFVPAAAAAPAPEESVSAESSQQLRSAPALIPRAVQDVVVTAARRLQRSDQAAIAGFTSALPDVKLVMPPPPPPPAAALTRYAAGTLIQAGPGIPSWDYGAYPYSWSGAVDPAQTVRFVVLGPVAVALWRLVGVGLLALLFLALACGGTGARLPWAALRAGARAALLVVCLAGFAPQRAAAQATPDGQILTALGERLTEAPRCAPTCADIAAAALEVTGDRVRIDLEISALALVALPIPAAEHWRIEALSVDGASSLALTREPDAALWLPLASGAHRVHLEGRLLADSVPLAFPLAPRAVGVRAQGWDVAGLDAGRLVSGTLVLTRQRRGGDAGTGASRGNEDFPPFVDVRRTFHLGVDWSVSTELVRVAPAAAAFTVAVPLVPGESVLTQGLTVSADGTVLVGLAAGEGARAWASGLAQRSELTLRMTASPARAEVWRFEVSPMWRVSFKGPPALLPADPGASTWIFEYRPQVGETLQLEITRPPALAGSTFAIDAVSEHASFAQRDSVHRLELHYRSTAGGRHSISLPADAMVTAVSVDGAPSQIRPERGELPLTILPGEHAVEVNWRAPAGADWLLRPAAIDLHAPASNITTEVTLPPRRWVLGAYGAGVGPVFVYWLELVLFVVLAWRLGRLGSSPLRVAEWLWLGLGLSMLSWWVLLLVAVWLYALRWREQYSAAALSAARFNLMQAALGLLTLGAVLALVLCGVRYGLRGTPDLGVGVVDPASTFTWFNDATRAALPQPVLISVPLLVYRVLMFAWSVWVAVALARWLRRSWMGLTREGLWRLAPGSAAAAEGSAGVGAPPAAVPNP